jgi:hypothetical protein
MYRLHGLVFVSGQWQKTSLPQNIHSTSDPASLIFDANRGLFLQQVIWPGNEINQLPLSSAEVKNEYSNASFGCLRLHGKDKDNLASLKHTRNVQN